MKIKVIPSRLQSQLNTHGIATGPTLAGQDSFTFVRRTSQPDLFGRIVVEAAGKQSEAVWASVGITLTRRLLIRNLFEQVFLMELAGNRGRNRKP